MQELPPDLSKVTTLRFLDLSFNQLQSLPMSLSSLSGLSALNISFNPLQVGSSCLLSDQDWLC